MKVIYYGHDLHFLREMREYEVTGDETFRESAENWRWKEHDLMKKADHVVMPVSYTHLDVYKRQALCGFRLSIIQPALRSS